MNKEELTNIALFPIPNLVTFPHSVVPLHVFEPRYRKMIQDCIDNGVRIGVCHVEETLSEAKKGQSLEETLNSNQATYQPQNIFSAGFCELKETLEDGRLLVNIKMDGRYQLKNRVQHVPYQIYECESYNDADYDENMTETMREKLNGFLMKFAAQNEDPRLTEFLESQVWQEQSNERYSFGLFELLKFDSDFSQEILELKSPQLRLEFACRLLNIPVLSSTH